MTPEQLAMIGRLERGWKALGISVKLTTRKLPRGLLGATATFATKRSRYVFDVDGRILEKSTTPL